MVEVAEGYCSLSGEQRELRFFLQVGDWKSGLPCDSRSDRAEQTYIGGSAVLCGSGHSW